MASRYIRDTAILAKIETTSGTDSVPTGGANAILVSNVKITPLNINLVSRDVIRNYFGASEQLPGAIYKSVSFDVEIVGSGTAGTAPAWGVLLRACGFSETATASTRVDYLPITNSQESATIYVYDSGVLHKFLYAKGGFDPNLELNAIPKATFNFIAIDGGDSAATPGTTSYASFQTPAVITDANAGDITFGATHSSSGAPALTGGTVYPSTGLSLSSGIKVQHMPLLGGETVEITDREVTAKFKLDLTAAQEVTFIGTVKAATTQSMGFQYGSGTGKKTLFFAPAVQLANTSKEDFNGKRLIGFDARLVPTTSGSGNDELRIVTSF